MNFLINNLPPNEGDIIQIRANVDTNNVKLHLVQVFVGYNLVNKNIILKDQPIEDEEADEFFKKIEDSGVPMEESEKERWKWHRGIARREWETEKNEIRNGDISN